MQPDNDSPARKLWTASKNWLTVERLLHAHTRVIQEVEEGVKCVLGDEPPEYPDDHRPLERNYPLSDENVEDSEHRNNNDKGDSGDKNSDSRLSLYKSSPFDLQWTLKKLERCSNLVQDDLLKPTANLLDMVRPRDIFAFFSRGCIDLTCLSSLDVQICRYPRHAFVAEPQRKPVETQLDYFHLLATDFSLGIFRHERRLVLT